MHIRLELPRARLRRWHLWLAEHLSNEATNHISFVFTDAEPATPTALNLLLSLEALTHSAAPNSGTAAITPDEILNAVDNPSSSCDVVVRIGGVAVTDTNQRVVTLLIDDQPREDALWLALLERRTPKIGICSQSGGVQADCIPQCTAYPGLEAPHVLSHSADAVFSRAIELIASCVADPARAANDSSGQSSATENNAAHPAHTGRFILSSANFLARRVGDKARAVLQQVTKSAPQWSVAWRRRHPISPDAVTRLDIQDFQGLPDDGARYYADPFALDKDGVTHVFVEEFPYATERGLISTFTVDEHGHCSAPRPVLETQFHLSYPQVFDHAGEIFMLPEASASGSLDLYRAENFPDAWVHDTRLIDEPLHDATLHFDGTRWWLFAATQFLKSSSWCALKVFTAETLRGPWQPISTSPVKVDVHSARPAGGLISHGGALWRPAQNCAAGYGHGLTWCRVDCLTPDTFAEHTVGSMQFARTNTCLGPHTWTATQTIETLDLFAALGARPPAAPTTRSNP